MPPPIWLSEAPADRRVLRTLKDGYWDRTEVIELPDGSRRVRKRSKGAAFGPWGVESLRREIRYLTTLTDRARVVFPPVLTAWDDGHADTPDAGYEMPFYAQHVDAGDLARRGALAQAEIDAFQDALAEAVVERLHEAVKVDESLAAHVVSVVEHAWTELEKDQVLARLINAEHIELNGARMPGPRAAFAQIVEAADTLAALDAPPRVRLHGDLFLENILWRPQSARPERVESADGSVAPSEKERATDGPPRLILVDPVSVAGVSSGPPVFDLVKYESYASGELLALRSEWVEVGGFDDGGAYRFRIRWEDSGLAPFRDRDWRSRFRRAFEAKHGPVDCRLYRLIDGYFSAAMAVNTGGAQRRARLLKAMSDFNAVLRDD